MGRVRFVAVPGLRKQTGLWAYCAGVFDRRVVRDPLCETVRGGNALIIHEYTHAFEWHALKGIIILVLSLGVLYPWWRRRCERRADATALWCTSEREFVSFVHMHPQPKTWWGEWLYEPTHAKRIDRARKDTDNERYRS